jgi:hypothetical protein
MRWQRIAMNAPAQKRRALTGGRLVRSSWGPLAELSGDVKQPSVRKKDF